MAKKEISLDYPVTIDGVEVKQLQMRRAKVRDQLAAEETGGNGGAMEVRLFANLCEVTPATIEELDLFDYGKLQDVYTGFLASPPKPAGRPS